MDALANLRKYKVSEKGFGEEGISIFDLVTAFLGAYLLDRFLNISNYLPGNKKKILLYLLVIPVGILFHYIFNVDSYLTRKLLEQEFNVYKAIVLAHIAGIVYTLY